ncbi:peptidylprolyl isomerase [Dasania marina]|uniref:FKBP-type peptidyl-prolyl cis-trans isomerase n=1 Tax=Dasania marina TaxID=471499 RepID=UPI0030D8BBDC|tara:strand:+ start:34271 stop:34753 length:483 start_codon:yes stop_codon:yes gene_type:complete
MQATKDTVVSFHYSLFDAQGEKIESSLDAEPNLFLFGYNNVLAGVESSIEGKSTGDKLEIELAPEDAFGARKADMQQRVPSKYLKHEGKMKPGQTVRINTEQGMQVGTVVKVGKFNVDVDLNHPLVDQAVRFEIEVMDVRAATEDEITHGHAHGKGGHHH